MRCAIGYYQGDLDQAQRLATWMKRLGPYTNHTLVVARDISTDQRPFHDIGFEHVEEIIIADDIWNKWPESCNNAFQHIARHIQFHPDPTPWLWLEPDVVPLRTGWLDAIEAEYKACGKPFLGDYVSVPNIPDHMSGVAVYPADMVRNAGLALITSELAWDMAAISQTLPKMAKSSLIMHAWKHPRFENKEQIWREIFAFKPMCVLFHADKSGSLIELLSGEDVTIKRGLDGCNDGKCSVDGCEKQAHATGVCRMHYARRERNGNFDLQPKLSFLEKLEQNRVVDENGCWIWTGGVNAGGYGQVYQENVAGPKAVHRLSFEFHIGEIPEGLLVCHKCDVRRCFNPDHLFAGTDLDNMRDAVQKGRIRSGETHQSSKLSDKQVAEIRERYSWENVSQYELAEEYGCSQSNVSMIVLGLTRNNSGAEYGSVGELRPGQEGESRRPSSPLEISAPELPVVDILVKSYQPDFEMLKYCIQSVAMHATGFRQLILIVPQGTADVVKPLTECVSQAKIHIVEVVEGGDGYLFQQAIKATSNEFSDAEFFLHIDSDTVLTKPVTPQTFMRNGKALWLMTPYKEIEDGLKRALEANPDLDRGIGVMAWKEVAEKFMGEPVEFEFMRRFPILIPRFVYLGAQVFCMSQHGQRLTDYILSQPLRHFSEFNALGAFAYQRFRNEIEWLDTTKEELPEQVLNQAWSWGGMTDEVRKMFETALNNGAGSGLELQAPTFDPALIEDQPNGSEKINFDQAVLKRERQVAAMAHARAVRAENIRLGIKPKKKRKKRRMATA